MNGSRIASAHAATLTLSLGLLLAAAAAGDEPYFATLNGHVRDSQGRPLAGVAVTVWGDGAGRGTRATGRDGAFRFPALRPLTHYSVTADLRGYRPVTYDGILLQAGRARAVDFRLKRPGEREVVALVTRDPYPFQDLVHGFTHGLDLPVRVIDLDQEADPSATVRRVRAERPNLVLGAGLRAARLIRREIPDVPAILTLISDPRRYELETPTTCFLATAPDASEVLHRLVAILPSARRIGVVYDADLSALLARDLREAADRAGLTIELRPCYRAQRLEETLDTLRGRIDALLVPFDPLSVAPEAIDRLTRWSLRNHVPLAAPGPEWVRRGALFSYAATPEQMGEQASRIAAGILYQGRHPADFGLRLPEDHQLAVNRGTAEALSIPLPEDLEVEAAH